MRPNNTSDSTSDANPPGQRSLNVPSRDAAVNVVRRQLDAIYGGEPIAEPAKTAQPPHKATQHHQSHTQQHPAQTGDQWQQYHTAWQEYYQKYYEHYYTSHMRKVMHEKATTTQLTEHTPIEEKTSPSQATGTPEAKNEQLYALRDKLRTNLEQSAKKARKSRHFIPIASALCVVVVFAFLQYNRVLISNVKAYVTPGSIDPQNIVVDPTAAVQVGPEPKLIIPKINVDVPAVYGIGSDHASQMSAMEKGVAHFAIPGANSVPGQIGNTVLAGHSSNDLFDNGSYKFIFVQLDKLNNGDMIYANYEGKRYSYSVTKKEVVKPSEVTKLTYPTDKPVMTLITCVPIGTAEKRLLVTAEQVSPDPAAASAAPAATSGASAEMTGNSATLLQRLFGGGN